MLKAGDHTMAVCWQKKPIPAGIWFIQVFVSSTNAALV